MTWKCVARKKVLPITITVQLIRSYDLVYEASPLCSSLLGTDIRRTKIRAIDCLAEIWK